jgi:uridylate kinase
MSYFFGIDPEKGIAHDMKNVRDLLKTRNIIICGALRYASNQTSDSTSVKLAAYLKASFVNLTNVKGLYDKNPLTDKSAKFIPKATIEELNKIVMAIPNKPGMHAPLDHAAMRTIKQHKIKTYIIGKDAKQLDNFLNKKAFIGTIVE